MLRILVCKVYTKRGDANAISANMRYSFMGRQVCCRTDREIEKLLTFGTYDSVQAADRVL
jgi:hypothetical protein